MHIGRNTCARLYKGGFLLGRKITRRGLSAYSLAGMGYRTPPAPQYAIVHINFHK